MIRKIGSVILAVLIVFWSMGGSLFIDTACAAGISYGSGWSSTSGSSGISGGSSSVSSGGSSSGFGGSNNFRAVSSLPHVNTRGSVSTIGPSSRPTISSPVRSSIGSGSGSGPSSVPHINTRGTVNTLGPSGSSTISSPMNFGQGPSSSSGPSSLPHINTRGTGNTFGPGGESNTGSPSSLGPGPIAGTGPSSLPHINTRGPAASLGPNDNGRSPINSNNNLSPGQQIAADNLFGNVNGMSNPLDIGKALSGQNPKVNGNVGDQMAGAGNGDKFAQGLGTLPTDQQAFALGNMDPKNFGSVVPHMDPSDLIGVMSNPSLSPETKGQMMDVLPTSIGTQVMTGVASIDSGMAARIGTNMDPQQAANIYADMKGNEGPSRGMPMSSQIFAHPQDMNLNDANKILSMMPEDVRGSINANIAGNYPGFFAVHGGTLMFYPDHSTMIQTNVNGKTPVYSLGPDGSWTNQAGETPEQAAARAANGGFNQNVKVGGSIDVNGVSGSVQVVPANSGQSIQPPASAPVPVEPVHQPVSVPPAQQWNNAINFNGIDTTGDQLISGITNAQGALTPIHVNASTGGVTPLTNPDGTVMQIQPDAGGNFMFRTGSEAFGLGVGTIYLVDGANNIIGAAAQSTIPGEGVTPYTHLDTSIDRALSLGTLGNALDPANQFTFGGAQYANTYSDQLEDIRATSKLCGYGSSMNPLSGLPPGVQAFLDYRKEMAKQPISVASKIPLACYGTKAAVINMPDGTIIPAITNAVFTVPVSYGSFSKTIADASELSWNPWAYGYENVSDPNNPVIIDGAQWLAGANQPY